MLYLSSGKMLRANILQKARHFSKRGLDSARQVRFAGTKKPIHSALKTVMWNVAVRKLTGSKQEGFQVFCPLTGWPTGTAEPFYKEPISKKPTVALYCPPRDAMITSNETAFRRFFLNFHEDPATRMNASEHVRVFKCAKGVQCICDQQHKESSRFEAEINELHRELAERVDENGTELYHKVPSSVGIEAKIPIEDHIQKVAGDLHVLCQEYRATEFLPASEQVKKRQEILERFRNTSDEGFDAIWYSEL